MGVKKAEKQKQVRKVSESQKNTDADRHPMLTRAHLALCEGAALWLAVDAAGRLKTLLLTQRGPRVKVCLDGTSPRFHLHTTTATSSSSSRRSSSSRSRSRCKAGSSRHHKVNSSGTTCTCCSYKTKAVKSTAHSIAAIVAAPFLSSPCPLYLSLCSFAVPETEQG